MTLRQFYDWQTLGGSGDVSSLVTALEKDEIPWCMIGGLAVNHWALEPMATADVDVVIVTERLEQAVAAFLEAGFAEKRFQWPMGFKGKCQVSIQIRTEDFYKDFPSRSVPADVHGILMRVAGLEDTLTGKLKAYSDFDRRPTKRQKDLLDISRLIEAHPELKSLLPQTVSERLES